MKTIKNIIDYLIVITIIPAIVLTVKSVTELKDVRNVQYELLSEEEGVFNITPGTYKNLVANKRIKNYELESNYPLITQEEMERATWYINDDLKNEIFIDEYGQKRIRVNVGKVTFSGSENWVLDADYGDVLRFVLPRYVNNSKTINKNFNNGMSNLFPLVSTTYQYNNEGFQILADGNVYINILKSKLSSLDTNGFKQWLQDRYNEGNPLTVFYELADKQTRPVEVYDFSKFRLVYDKNRIRVIFDIDDSYYLWEITKDDKLIPINGQYDQGGVWTVKFYVYEIQQPMIRTLVLLIPLIVVSGALLYMYNIIKKKGLSY